MLDFLGTIAITAAVVATITATIGTLPIRPRQRLALAALVGAWIGLSVVLAAAGEYADAGRRPFPLIGVMLAIPLIATGAAAILSPAVRSALLALPMPLLVGLNAARVFGGFFLLLAMDGRLGGPFPHAAGWGDVITGVLALPVAWLAAQSASARAWPMIGAWNAFGALDLVLAVFLGVTSATGSPLQLFYSGAGSWAMQFLPWTLIPTVLVPLFLITHAIILTQLRRRGRAARQPKLA